MDKANKVEKAEKALWDAYHTRIFCELCARECGAGNRPGPFLSPRGYENLGESFLQITKKRYVRLQFKNRWDSLKTLYCQWKELQIAASGLGWNAKLGTIDADSDWWNIHLKKHPEHAWYRNVGPPNLPEMDVMFDDCHVTGAEFSILGETPLDKEAVTTIQDDTDSVEEDDEVIKAKSKKQRKTESTKDDFSAQDEKNPFVQMYKKATDAICVTAESIKEASSSNKAPPPSPVAPSMNEAMEMVRECGVEEGTPFFFSSSMLFMKPEYREMFTSIQTMEGRFDWLERAHEML